MITRNPMHMVNGGSVSKLAATGTRTSSLEAREKIAHDRRRKLRAAAQKLRDETKTLISEAGTLRRQAKGFNDDAEANLLELAAKRDAARAALREAETVVSKLRKIGDVI